MQINHWSIQTNQGHGVRGIIVHLVGGRNMRSLKIIEQKFTASAVKRNNDNKLWQETALKKGAGGRSLVFPQSTTRGRLQTLGLSSNLYVFKKKELQHWVIEIKNICLCLPQRADFPDKVCIYHCALTFRFGVDRWWRNGSKAFHRSLSFFNETVTCV